MVGGVQGAERVGEVDRLGGGVAKVETAALLGVAGLSPTTGRVVAPVGQTSGDVGQVSAALGHVEHLELVRRTVHVAQQRHAELVHAGASATRLRVRRGPIGGALLRPEQ